MGFEVSEKNRWIYWFVVVDIVFIISTILLRYIPSEANIFGYGTFRLLLRQMDLGYEMTIGAWWLGLNIFIASLLSYEIFSKKEEDRFAWLFLSVVFLGLSVDEIGSIHERVFHSWFVIAGVFLVGVIPFIYAVWQILRRRESRKAAFLIIVGFGVMTSAVPIEYLQHHIKWPSRLMGLRVGFEESVEIFGTLICLVAIVQQRQNLSWSNTWSRVIPNPLFMRGLYAVLIGGFVVHIIVAVLTSLFWEIGHWGSPSVFFPSFIFVVLSSVCFWVYQQYSVYKPDVWRYKSYILFAVSLISFYLVIPEATTIQYFVYLGDISDYEKISALWLVYTFVVSYIMYYRESVSDLKSISLIFSFTSSLAVALTIDNQMVYTITAGIASLLVGILVLDDCKKVDFESGLGQEEDDGLHYSMRTRAGSLSLFN